MGKRQPGPGWRFHLWVQRRRFASARKAFMRRADLVADCASCAGVCCVAGSFEASEDFAIDKAAGIACQHLTEERRCAIHAERARRGYPGCTVFDCYGAGPRVTRAFAEGRGSERQRDAVFLVSRELHELLWLLTESAKICPDTEAELACRLTLQIGALDALASGPVLALSELDVDPIALASRLLLREVGQALGGRSGARSLPVVR